MNDSTRTSQEQINRVDSAGKKVTPRLAQRRAPATPAPVKAAKSNLWKYLAVSAAVGAGWLILP